MYGMHHSIGNESNAGCSRACVAYQGVGGLHNRNLVHLKGCPDFLHEPGGQLGIVRMGYYKLKVLFPCGGPPGLFPGFVPHASPGKSHSVEFDRTIFLEGDNRAKLQGRREFTCRIA